MLSYDDDNRGGWLAAATGGRLVMLPAADSAARARVWASLLDGSSEQSARAVLDELTAGGLSKTPPFALLTWENSEPTTVRVFVRGEVVVVLTTADGDLSIGGLGISTWVERSVADVTAVSVSAVPVSVDADPIGTDDLAVLPLGAGFPLQSGMVHTRRLRLVVDGARAAETARAESAVAEPAQAKPALQIVPPPPAAPKTVPAPLPLPNRRIAEPASEQTISDIAAAEPAAESAAESAAAPIAAQVAEPDADAAGGYDHLFGATVMRGVEQAAVRPDAESDDDESAAPTGAAAASAAGRAETEHDDDERDVDVPGDHDGHTVMSGDIQKMRDSRRRAAAESAPAAGPAAEPRLYLLLPSGVREPLTQPIRVGRAPSVSKISGGLVPKLVSLGGADQDVSRNHVHFTVEGDTVVVTDLHSRNGTLVVLPGKPAQKLRQGEPTAVIVGTVIDLGSGITLTVGQE